MAKTTINYKTSEELWRIEDELKENGFTKTADCYWSQTFDDGKGNHISTVREN